MRNKARLNKLSPGQLKNEYWKFSTYRDGLRREIDKLDGRAPDGVIAKMELEWYRLGTYIKDIVNILEPNDNPAQKNNQQTKAVLCQQKKY